MTAFHKLHDQLTEVTGVAPRQYGQRMQARCPAHEDREPSLSVRAVNGAALVHCFAGCHIDDILAALGMTRAELYDGADPSWTYVREPPDDPHGFRQAQYAASTAYLPKPNYPGRPVVSW